jgi:CRISPR/Cas system CMR subunit Cmr6 (Cas7 group RAMP superfamily)
MFKFEKVNNTKFIIKDASDIERKADELINSISNDNSNKFEQSINNTLKDSIISRMTAVAFFETMSNQLSDVNFVTVDLKLSSRTLTVSVGKAIYGADNTKYLNGVLYK